MRKVYHRTFFKIQQDVWLQNQIELFYWLQRQRGLFIINNIHRYMLYLAIIILSVKFYDVVLTTDFGGGTRGISIGSLDSRHRIIPVFMCVSSCHSFRHIRRRNGRWRGGISGVFGSLYRSVSKVNVHHSFWFWTSLAMVFLGDLFVIAVSENIISDRILLEW